GNIIAPCGEDGRSMADESEAAAIEFCTLALNISDIIVCGHSECGAMRILAEGNQSLPAPHLHAWLRHAEGALRQVKAGARMNAQLPLHNHVSQYNVLQQLENLRTYPLVRERLDAGRLRLHAWWFDIAQAELLAYEEQSGKFIIIDDDEAERIMSR